MILVDIQKLSGGYEDIKRWFKTFRKHWYSTSSEEHWNFWLQGINDSLCVNSSWNQIRV